MPTDVAYLILLPFQRVGCMNTASHWLLTVSDTGYSNFSRVEQLYPTTNDWPISSLRRLQGAVHGRDSSVALRLYITKCLATQKVLIKLVVRPEEPSPKCRVSALKHYPPVHSCKDVSRMLNQIYYEYFIHQFNTTKDLESSCPVR